MVIQEQEKMLVHSKKQAQIRALLFHEAHIKIPIECSNYNNIFLVENVAKLPENTGINKYTIKLE